MRSTKVILSKRGPRSWERRRPRLPVQLERLVGQQQARTPAVLRSTKVISSKRRPRSWERRRPRLPVQLERLVGQQQARTPAVPGLALLFCMILLAPSCQREQRQFEPQPPNQTNVSVTMSDLRPGATQAPAQTKNPAEEHAYDVNEGKRLYTQYNCSGCHFNGGGGIGPPLMDEKWIYGSESENIYSTIVEGRPNGMPSFRQKIPDYQVWELAAYVKTLSSQLRKDIEPGRSDDLNPHNSEQRSERKRPQHSNQPPSTQAP